MLISSGLSLANEKLSPVSLSLCTSVCARVSSKVAGIQKRRECFLIEIWYVPISPIKASKQFYAKPAACCLEQWGHKWTSVIPFFSVCKWLSTCWICVGSVSGRDHPDWLLSVEGKEVAMMTENKWLNQRVTQSLIICHFHRNNTIHLHGLVSLIE